MDYAQTFLSFSGSPSSDAREKQVHCQHRFDLLRLCKHRGVVVALDLIGTDLILELLEGPSLEKVIADTKGLKECEARPLCKQRKLTLTCNCDNS